MEENYLDDIKRLFFSDENASGPSFVALSHRCKVQNIDNRGGIIIERLTKKRHKPSRQKSGQPEQAEVAPVYDFSENRIRENIIAFMAQNTKNNKRWWFAIYRVLKDEAYISDMAEFELMMCRLFDDNLPVRLDANELSKNVEIDSFSRPFDQWDPANAPVKPATFKIYCKLVTDFRNLFIVNSL